MSTTEAIELAELYRLTNNALKGKGLKDPLLDDVYGDPPWLTRPGDSVPFYPKTSVACPAVGSAATIVTFQVPDGSDGVIEEFSVNFVGGGFVNGSGELVFRLLRNGAAVRNFENMISEYGTQDTPVKIGGVRIFGGDIYTVTVNHVSNPALNGSVLASLRGYFYPNRGR